MQNGTAIDEPHASASAERWVLVVRGTPRAMRRWLKSALRGYGIRCEDVTTTTPAEQLAASRAEVLALRAELDQLQNRQNAAIRAKRGPRGGLVRLEEKTHQNAT